MDTIIIIFTAVVTLIAYFTNCHYLRKGKKIDIAEVKKAVVDKQMEFYTEDGKIYVSWYQDNKERYVVGVVTETDEYKKGYEQGEKDMLRGIGAVMSAKWQR